MKKIFLIIGLLFVSYLGISQSVVVRSTGGNTVEDMRLMGGKNLFPPRYADTATATLPINIGIDTCGAIIFTYDVDAFWYRACSPYKHWVLVGTGSGLPSLPDGLYAGGDVAWSGTGLTFDETAASYVLGGVSYNSASGQVTLQPADPTFDRIDVIGLDSTGPIYVTGVPSANPQEPSIDPNTQIRRAIVTVPANSPIPAITTNILYDQNAGTPTEWDVSTTGTGLFGNTNFPYHLTIAAAFSNFVSGQTITFANSDTIYTGARGSLVFFIRLAAPFSATQTFNVTLYNGTTIQGQTLSFSTYGMSPLITGQYQAVVMPTAAFSPNNLIIDKVVVTATGAGTFPQFNLDYVQFQTGIIPVTTFPNQKFGDPNGDNFSTFQRNFDFNNFDFTFDNINKFTARVTGNSDSAFFVTGTSGGGNLLRISGITGIAYVSNFDAGGGTFKVDGAKALVPNGHWLEFNTGGFILSYQQPTPFTRAYPGINAAETQVNLRLSNDTNGPAPDSAVYKPFQVLFKNFSDGVEREKAYINARGYFWESEIPHTATADTFFVYKDGLHQGVTTAEARSILGAGGTNLNIGSGFRVAVPTTNNIKTVFGNVTLTIDSSSNANALTFKVDTTVVATRAYASNLVTTYFNTNVGSSYRWAIPGTNTIKTLRVLNGILADSATSNTISIQVDSSQYATKAFVNSVAGGGGFTGVTSVSVVNANGFFGSVATSTTTPAITITTTVTGLLKGNGTAISAATSGTDYAPATSGTAILKGNGAGGFANAVAQTDYTSPAVTTLASLTTAAALTTVGTLTSGSISTGFIVRGVTMTVGSDAAFDTYYRNGAGILTRLGNGTTGQVLTATSGAAPSWQTVASALTINSSIINSGTAGRILYQNASNQVSQSANLFFDVTNNRIQSRIFLNAGTATANTAPLKFTTGVNLTTPESGAMEFDATNYYLTVGATRKRIPLTNNATPANGQIPIGNGTDYTVANITAGDNGTVITNGAGTISVRSNSTPQTLTTSASITWNVANGENAILVLANTGATLNIQNPVSGHTYVLRITQGTGGSRTITTWPAGTIWPSGTAPTLGTAVGAKNLISFFYDGVNFYGAFNTNIYQ